jgi:hypothetical protein
LTLSFGATYNVAVGGIARRSKSLENIVGFRPPPALVWLPVRLQRTASAPEQQNFPILAARSGLCPRLSTFDLATLKEPHGFDCLVDGRAW